MGCYNKLGCLKEIQQKYQEAFEFINKAIAIGEMNISGNKEELYVSYIHMGRLTNRLGQSDPLAFMIKATKMGEELGYFGEIMELSILTEAMANIHHMGYKFESALTIYL